MLTCSGVCLCVCLRVFACVCVQLELFGQIQKVNLNFEGNQNVHQKAEKLRIQKVFSLFLYLISKVAELCPFFSIFAEKIGYGGIHISINYSVSSEMVRIVTKYQRF